MQKNELINHLLSFGFSEDQAHLYIAGLELGMVLMAPLAKKADIPRSTAYYSINELIRRKFFSTRKKGRRIFYIATSPEQMVKNTEERLILVKKLLPKLRDLSRD